jgi:hypothetical protein
MIKHWHWQIDFHITTLVYPFTAKLSYCGKEKSNKLKRIGAMRDNPFIDVNHKNRKAFGLAQEPIVPASFQMIGTATPCRAPIAVRGNRRIIGSQ